MFLEGQGFTGPLAFGVIVATILLIFGIIGWLFSERFGKHPSFPGVATATSERQQLNIVVAVILALILFILSNKFIPELAKGALGYQSVVVLTFFGNFELSTATLGAATNAFLFSVILIPTAEENFFRGFWANLAISKAGPFVGVLFQAVIFMLFHIPALGIGISTIIIFADGFIIGGLDEETGRISVGILAHVGNNFLAFVVVTGSVVVYSPLFAGVPVGQLITLPLLLGAWAFVRVRKGVPVLPAALRANGRP
jgi:membrane protease YdiL (CAAX protease family)